MFVAERKSSERSSRPIIVSLLMEFLSRNLRRAPPASATLERAEYARRDKDMLWYLLRGSIWESYTRCVDMAIQPNLLVIIFGADPRTSYRPKLESFVEKTAHTPLIGLFGALAKDWIPLIDDYYYCA